MEHNAFFMKYKVSRPEPLWLVFYRPQRTICRPNLISRIKRAMQNTLPKKVNQWSKTISVTLVTYFTHWSVKFGKNTSSNSF